MGHPHLQFERSGTQSEVAIIRLARNAKRNALSDDLVLALRDVFENLPDGVRAAVLDGEGEHFCAGLDLNALSERDAVAGLHHSRMWHAAMERVQYSPVPVIAALHGAVVGGGLELACACHIRVADTTTYFALPESSRGIFVGGGGAVRIPRLIGTARMMDMMLTGRVFNADEGERMGLVNYLVPPGRALDKAVELAQKVAGNAALTNYAITHVLPRIAEAPGDQGFLTEAMMAGIAQSAPEAKQFMRAFLEGRAAKVRGA